MFDLYCSVAANTLPIYRALGKRLREARREAGMTQSQLARAVELSRTSITNIETGRQPVYLHMFIRLANVVGVSAAELLPANAETETSEEMAKIMRKLPSEKRDWVARIISSQSSEGGLNAAEILASKEKGLGSSESKRRKKGAGSGGKAG